MKKILTFILIFTVGILSVKSSNIYDLKPNGYVNDFANVIDKDIEQKLNNLIADFEKKSDVEIAVLTIESLNGEDPFEYSLHMAQKWGVGKKGQDNGIMLFVSINDRKWQIQIGYGLEGVFTDATSSSIARRELVPEFKKQNYGAGLFNTVNAIISDIGSENIAIKKERLEKERILRKQQEAESREAFLNVLNIVIIVMLCLVVLLVLLKVISYFNKLKRERIFEIEDLRKSLNNHSEIIDELQNTSSVKGVEVLTEKNNLINEKLNSKIRGTKNELISYQNFVKEISSFRNECIGFSRTIINIQNVSSDFNNLKSSKHSQLKSLFTKIQNDVNEVPTEFHWNERENLKNLYETKFSSINYSITEYVDLQNKLKEIKSTINSHSKNIKKVESSVENCRKYATDIDNLGYKSNSFKYNKQVGRDLQSKMEEIQSIFETNIGSTFKLISSYTLIISDITNSERKLYEYKSEILSSQKIVREFNSNYLWDRLNTLKRYKSWTRKIDQFSKSITLLEVNVEKFKNTDPVKMKNEISDLETSLNDEINRAKSKKREEEEAERRRKAAEKRRREEEEAARRRRNSYSSYGGGYGGGSYGGGSSGGSFGGGSFGGGGSGGSW